MLIVHENNRICETALVLFYSESVDSDVFWILFQPFISEQFVFLFKDIFGKLDLV